MRENASFQGYFTKVSFDTSEGNQLSFFQKILNKLFVIFISKEMPYPLHSILPILATNFIQKRRGQTLLFVFGISVICCKFDINVKVTTYMDRVGVYIYLIILQEQVKKVICLYKLFYFSKKMANSRPSA